MDERRHSFRSLFRAGKRERLIAQAEEGAERAHVKEGKQRWGVHRKKMKEYLYSKEKTKGLLPSLESEFPGITKEIEYIVNEARNKGHKVLMADLAGDADGKQLGATKTLCLSLFRGRKDTKHHKTIVGNLFQKGPQADFLKAWDTEDGDMVLVFFLPVGGLDTGGFPLGSPNETYTSTRLFDFFEEIYKRLPSPSLFVIQLSTVTSKETRAHFIRELTERNIRFRHNVSAEKVLILK